MKNEFPVIWRRTQESNEVIDILRLRRSLVQQRTQCYKRLQALAHSIGMPKGQMKSKWMQSIIKAAEMDEASSIRRRLLFAEIELINGQIEELRSWLDKKAESDSKVELLMTQKGVGPLTALVTVHSLGDVSRFQELSPTRPLTWTHRPCPF